MPAENEKDMADFPDILKNSMKLPHWVEQMDDVLKIALGRPNPRGSKKKRRPPSSQSPPPHILLEQRPHQ